MPAAAIAVLGVILALAGAGFASPSLVVPGIALALLGGLALAWTELAVRGAALIRQPGPARVVEGDAYPLRIELGRGLVPPPGGAVHDELLARPVPVGPRGPRRVDLELRMARRGRIALGAGSWTIGDPLGLHRRRVTAPPAGELLVLPRIEPVEAGAVGIAGEGPGAARSPADQAVASVRETRAVDFEVDGLRPYREGSPASRIHWAAVARTGEMYERRLAAGGVATPLVVLEAEDPANRDALDRAVRAAASLCVHLAPRSGCAALLPGHRVAIALDRDLRSWPALHARFAVVAGGTPTMRPASASRRGSVLWVTAGAPDRALARLAAFGRGPHYVVSACPPPDAPAAFRVAGCSALAVRGPSHAARRAA